MLLGIGSDFWIIVAEKLKVICLIISDFGQCYISVKRPERNNEYGSKLEAEIE